MAAVALVFCVATSDIEEAQPTEPPDVVEPEPETGSEIGPGISAEVVLHNALLVDAVVRVRTLGDGVELDCDEVALDPGALLSERLFTKSATWTVPPSSNLAISSADTRTCHAVRVEGDEFAPRLLFWAEGELLAQEFPDWGRPDGRGVIALQTQGTATVLVGDPALLRIPTQAPRGTEQCAPRLDGRRLDWSTPLPTDGGQIVEAEFGLDGCFSVRMQSELAISAPWFLCVSEEAWPFQIGDEVRLEALYGTGFEGVVLTGAGFEQREGARLVVSRGTDAPSDPVLSFGFVPDTDCGFDVNDGCGAVTQAGVLQVSTESGAEVELRTTDGVAELVDADERTIRVEARTVQRRLVLDPECSGGPDVLGPDLELTLTTL